MLAHSTIREPDNKIPDMIQSKFLPTRAEQISKLQNPEMVYDVLVIGGGATGCGVALDSVTRGLDFSILFCLFQLELSRFVFAGLSTAMVELDDFSSGTSSRSTKLIHGGVRYLQKAIMKLDFEQYRMVREAVSFFY